MTAEVGKRSSLKLEIVQLKVTKGDVGRGGGDRTHDLRLKRPLLYH
jgi:hypothetical protein